MWASHESATAGRYKSGEGNMNNTEQFLNNIKQAKGFKAMLRNRLFGSLFNGIEAVSLDIKNNENKLAELSAKLENTEKKLDTLRNDFESVCVNVRNSNSMIESLKSDTELCKVKLQGIKRDMTKLSACTAAETPASVENVVSACTNSQTTAESDYESIDYFDFENHFRGSIENIKKSQEFYLKYFADKKNVLDIGCGRGEFLSLLKEKGISAKGIDIYEPYADYCRMNGLDAVCGDGTEYLAQCSGIDGIFVGQVVEHLDVKSIIRLCNTAYEKLSEGGCIVIETPNPTSLAIYTNAFYIDPSHVKPVHPLTMKYFLEKAGFGNIEIIYTENSRPQASIPALTVSGEGNTEEFNLAMKKVSDLLFGSQDYAVIAVK